MSSRDAEEQRNWRKARKYFGIKTKRSEECPEGFMPGRLGWKDCHI